MAKSRGSYFAMDALMWMIRSILVSSDVRSLCKWAILLAVSIFGP